MVDYNTKFTGQFIKSEAGQSLYDPFPTGKLVPLFNPNVSPLSPPLKSGITVPSSVPAINLLGPIATGIQHKDLSTSDTSATTGIISEVYKVIPALKNYEGKQKYVCFNCQSDHPTRHYYLQCQQLCIFPACLSSNSPVILTGVTLVQR